MKKLVVVLVSVLFLALFVTNTFWWQARDVWHEKEAVLYSQLGTYQQSLKATEDELANTQSEFAEFRSAKGAEIARLELELADAETQLDNAVEHVFLLAEELEDMKAYCEEARSQSETTGYWQGHMKALEGKVVLENSTYADLMDFLEATVLFHLSTDCCVDFAANLNNIAEEMGIRAGYVFLVDSYVNGGKWGHFINCFETVDKGIVYVEPQEMEDVTEEVAVDKPYKYNHGRVVKEIIISW